jgi:cytochrome P450
MQPSLSPEENHVEPSSPIAAASHSNPYPYYQRLQQGPALSFDPALGLWIASQAAVIEEIMANSDCQVRPLAEPVPKAIAGSSAGAVFARLMRMNEGAAHASARQVVGAALGGVDLHALAARSAMLASVHGANDSKALNHYVFSFPTLVVADMLGFRDDQLAQVTEATRCFVRCLSPLSAPDALRAASTAAQTLGAAFAQLAKDDVDGLAKDIGQRAARAGWDDADAITANLVGLLSQTHEATAGLIGNCIVALLCEPARVQQLRTYPELIDAFVDERAHVDPPVQNTRRFVAAPTSIAGVQLTPGDAILLLLAVPGQGKNLPFGHGRHACPGQAIALTIATAAVAHLLALPAALNGATLGWRYADSLNGRLPQFFDIA